MTDPAPDASSRRTHSFGPRFGLRGLLIFAIVFCLLFAWMGRNAYRMRQEEAALEALKRAGATVYLQGAEYPYERADAGWFGDADTAGRLVGWTAGRKVEFVGLWSEDPDDPALANALAAVSAFPEIRKVELHGVGITDETLVALHRLAALDSILLSGTHVTGAGVSRLGQLLPIREIFILSEAPVSELILSLADFRESRIVRLYLMPLSKPEIDALASIPRLEELRFTLVEPLADGLYEPLASAKKLKSLHFYGSGCSDADMSAVAKIEGLEELFVEDITDEGLAQLAPLTGLRRIALRVPITREAAMRFSAECPECLVRYVDPPGIRYYRAGGSIRESDVPSDDRGGFN